MRRVVAGLLVVCVFAFSVPVPAHADSDDGVITRYDLTATVARDGSTAVRIDFDIDFGSDAQHGPYVTLPIRQEIAGDNDHYRAFDTTGIRASSPSGAPAELDTDTGAGALAIKIGDPDRRVSGRQTYRLDYTVRGLVNPRVGGGADEISWNTIGTQWEIPLNDVTVTLAGPADVTRVNCFAGDPQSTQLCNSATPDDHRATFTASSISKGQGLTVVAAWPGGTFVGAEPRLIPRRNLGNLFEPEGGTIGAGVLVALLGSAIFLLRARRRRDEEYAGLTPGLTPTGTGSTSGATRAGSRTEVAVRFTPPDDVRPGVLGTLVEAKAEARDVTATIVDLAVRGELRIQEISKAESAARKQDWRLVRLPTSGPELTTWESELVDALFPDGEADDEVLLSDLKGPFAETVQKTKKSLYAEVTDRGWFRADPSRVRTWAVLLAVGVTVVGVALTIVLAITLGWACSAWGWWSPASSRSPRSTPWWPGPPTGRRCGSSPAASSSI